MSPRLFLTASTKARLACFRDCAAASAATVPVAFEQVPSVGDLPGVRRRAGNGRSVAAPAIARHDLHARPLGAPCLHCSGPAIRQDVDDPVPLEVADDRAVAVALLPRPIVHADHARRHGLAAIDLRAHAPQECVLADGEEKPPGHALPGPAAKGEADTAHQLLKPGRPARVWPRDPALRALGEDLPRAFPMRAAKPSHRQAHPNTATMGGDIRERAVIPAMDPPGETPALRTLRALATRMGRNDHLIRSDRHGIHNEARRQ